MRILWVKTNFLHPLDHGGRIRTYHMLRHLKREHHVTYIGLELGAASDDVRRRATEYCHELIVVPHSVYLPKGRLGLYLAMAGNLYSDLPIFVAPFKSPAMKQIIQSRLDERKDDLLVCDFLHAAVNIPPSPLPVPAILFQHNVEALIWQRLAQVEPRKPHRWYLHRQWRKTAIYERRTCRRFENLVAVSQEDAARMQADYGVGPVDVVPLGVDLDYFRPDPAAALPRPRSLVFTGSMDYLPNDDGMCWFLERIWPAVHRATPEASLTIVGGGPRPRLRELARQAPGDVRVTGRVPDVRPYVQAAAAFIVPLRVGGGTRLKIFEALAMEKPVISTAIGAEGLPLKNGEHFLLADDEKTFAAAILRVFESAPLATALGHQGARLVRTEYGWSNAANAFAAICQNLIASNTRSRTPIEISPGTVRR